MEPKRPTLLILNTFQLVIADSSTLTDPVQCYTEKQVLILLLCSGTIIWVLLPSLPLFLLPGESDTGAETATWAIQQPSRTRMDIVFILPQAMPVGLGNPLKNLLGPLSEVAISAPSSDWPGSRRRGKEGRKQYTAHIISHAQ